MEGQVVIGVPWGTLCWYPGGEGRTGGQDSWKVLPTPCRRYGRAGAAMPPSTIPPAVKLTHFHMTL